MIAFVVVRARFGNAGTIMVLTHSCSDDRMR